MTDPDSSHQRVGGLRFEIACAMENRSTRLAVLAGIHLLGPLSLIHIAAILSVVVYGRQESESLIGAVWSGSWLASIFLIGAWVPIVFWSSRLAVMRLKREKDVSIDWDTYAMLAILTLPHSPNTWIPPAQELRVLPEFDSASVRYWIGLYDCWRQART